MSSHGAAIHFVVGSRKLFTVRRRLATVSCGLAQLIEGVSPDFGQADAALDGYRVLSLSAAALPGVLHDFPHYVTGGLQHYRRHYIDMRGSFADYQARFSSKARSDVKRKCRKLAERSGGVLDVEEFRHSTGIDRFFDAAIPLSRRTYQARLLDAGLPETAADRAAARDAAAQDRLRAYLLRVDGQAIAYLYLPVHDTTLVYAFLGHDPDFSPYSPGTVLQWEALQRLFDEGRYRYFDFTEGEGAHKQRFGTDCIEACSFYLLRATLANRCLLTTLDAFDGAVAMGKQLATRGGVMARVRRVLRS